MTARADVVIVGAGPAGSTAAALLARAGHHVVVLEREVFPRFHVGESLLPLDVPVLERLGIVPERTGQFLCKDGAVFIDERTGRSTTFRFRDALPGGASYAFQVERAVFDNLLLEAAIDAGAEIHQGVKVTHTDLEAVEVGDEGGRRWSGRYLVDATGQDRLFGRRARSIEPYRGFGRGAVFCHVVGVRPAVRARLEETGNIHIYLLDDGWAWMIPLVGGRFSMGMVTREGPVRTERLAELVGTSPSLGELAAGATLTDPKVMRNFSYKNTAAFGSGWACIGDSACFLDPVFSSGLSLAMVAAEQLADRLSPALAEGREADPELMAPLRDQLEHAYATFGSLIQRFYHSRIVENLFFGAPDDAPLRRGIVSLLAGDVWRDDNRFQDMLLRARRHEVELG